MLKILLLALTLFSFSGCWDKEQKVCPKIETLAPVQGIKIEAYIEAIPNGSRMCVRLFKDANSTEDNGAICGRDAHTLFNWMKKIRRSETYYIEQITEYNKTFVDK